MKLNEYRKHAGLTRSEMAALIGTSAEAVRRYENGDRVPTPRVMDKIVFVTSGRVWPNDFMRQGGDNG